MVYYTVQLYWNGLVPKTTIIPKFLSTNWCMYMEQFTF